MDEEVRCPECDGVDLEVGTATVMPNVQQVEIECLECGEVFYVDAGRL